MVRVGGRTVYRMTDKVFDTKAAQSVIGKTKIADKVCEAVCEVFCGERDNVLVQMVKEKPDPTKIAENITDFRTIADMAAGGACACKCQDINTILPFLIQRSLKE